MTAYQTLVSRNSLTLSLALMFLATASNAAIGNPTEQLISKYGAAGGVSASGFQKLLSDLASPKTLDGAAAEVLKPFPLDHGNNTVHDHHQECYMTDSIFANFAAENAMLNSTGLKNALPAAILTLTNPDCRNTSNGTEHSREVRAHKKATTAEAWGYGMGFVVIVCLVSNVGALLGPIMKHRFFQRILLFLVALAVGALVATGILVLIPEAFNLMFIPELADDYLWKSSTIVISLYFFYLMERGIKIGMWARKKSKKRRLADQELTISPPEKEPFNSNCDAVPKVDVKETKAPVKTVAWLVMLGDGLHKFIDGLSIGAAYTENFYTGISLSIAIICEELPHELGDVAILLHSGMTMKKALLVNTISASCGFVGLAIGILLGENTDANRWIFAIAAGIFLYVSLVDMLPEMIEAADEYAEEHHSVLPVLFLQIFGLCVGFCIILLVSKFSEHITIG